MLSNGAFTSACARCLKQVGRGTGVKRLDCSRCGTPYCSVECQHIGWKTHKDYCQSKSRYNDHSETTALSARTGNLVNLDVNTFQAGASPTLMPFLAGLLQIGAASNDKTSTHLLILNFHYSPTETSVGRRLLPLRSATLVLRTDYAESLKSAGQWETLESLHAAEAKAEASKGSYGPAVSAPVVIWAVRFDVKPTPTQPYEHNGVWLVSAITTDARARLEHASIWNAALGAGHGTMPLSDALVAALGSAFAKLDL